MEDSLLKKNSGLKGSGFYLHDINSVHIKNCRFEGNGSREGKRSGGGVYCQVNFTLNIIYYIIDLILHSLLKAK